MDPISLVVAALALGAAAGVQDTAATAVKEAYGGLKRLISDRYGAASFDVDRLEQDPASKGRRAVVEEELAKIGATNDTELLEQASALIEAVRTHDPDAVRTIGLDLSAFRAKELEAEGITAESGAGSATGVRMTDSTVEGKAAFKDVRASGGSDDPKAEGQ